MTPIASTLPAKSVLLVDVRDRSCELRAKALRSFGVLVDCATSASSALGLFQSGTYNLVLIDLGSDAIAAERLGDDIRRAKPKQRVGFLVGSPLLIASSPEAKPYPSREKERPKLAAAPAPPPRRAASPSMDFGEMVQRAEEAQRADNAERE